MKKVLAVSIFALTVFSASGGPAFAQKRTIPDLFEMMEGSYKNAENGVSFLVENDTARIVSEPRVGYKIWEGGMTAVRDMVPTRQSYRSPYGDAPEINQLIGDGTCSYFMGAEGNRTKFEQPCQWVFSINANGKKGVTTFSALQLEGAME